MLLHLSLLLWLLYLSLLRLHCQLLLLLCLPRLLLLYSVPLIHHYGAIPHPVVRPTTFEACTRHPIT